MNKRIIDDYIPSAYRLLSEFGVAENGEIKKTFRGYISAFGAAIYMNNLRSAIAFNMQKNNAEESRELLIKIIYAIITEDSRPSEDENNLLKYVISYKGGEAELQEKIINASIAVKLAMNMYTLV